MAIDEKLYTIIDFEEFPLSQKEACYKAMASRYLYPGKMGKGLTVVLHDGYLVIVQSKEIARLCAEAEAKNL